MIYNLSLDDQILWQCPGYDADVGQKKKRSFILLNKFIYFFKDETHKFGCVAFKSTNKLNELLEFWAPDNITEILEIKSEFYLSTALTTLFNWLNGQAHCLGVLFFIN